MDAYIELNNITKRFGQNIVLENISFSVKKGAAVGLVGANGSGKSVLFKILCVFINSPGFVGIYSGLQNLKFLAAIQGKIGEREIREAMLKVGLDPENKTKVDNYSLGMKQKLGLAQAIMENQDILVLDEPFNALDYQTYEEMKQMLLELKAEGKTMFLTSHHYQDIELLCDQVYLIENHKIALVSGHLT